MAMEALGRLCLGAAGRSEERRFGWVVNAGAVLKPLSAKGIEREAPPCVAPGENQAKREGAGRWAVNQ